MKAAWKQISLRKFLMFTMIAMIVIGIGGSTIRGHLSRSNVSKLRDLGVSISIIDKNVPLENSGSTTPRSLKDSAIFVGIVGKPPASIDAIALHLSRLPRVNGIVIEDSNAGPILRSLVRFRSIGRIEIVNCSLSYDEIVQLASLRGVSELCVDGLPPLDGDKLLESFDMSNLKILWIKARLSDASAKKIAAAPRLTHLSLIGPEVSFTADGWSDIYSLQGLQSLSVNHIKLPSRFAQDLKIGGLRKLDISFTNANDGDVGTLCELKSLQELHVGHTSVTRRGYELSSGLQAKPR